MAKITENFTIEEMVNSSTATRLGIDNTPTSDQMNNIVKLVHEILQPIRDEYKKPIIVTSGFRCEKLNTAVGGVKTSQHLMGEAADIRTVSDSKEDNRELYMLIIDMVKKGMIVVGQIINEHNYDWIHISLPTDKKHNQILGL